MKFLKLKALFLIIFLIGFSILALPQFTLHIKGKQVKFSKIKVSKFGISAKFGSFIKGKDIFPEKEYTYKIDFKDTKLSDQDKEKRQLDLLNKIKTRANYAGLFDIDIYSAFSNNNYLIKFRVPANYESPDNYPKWLSATGEIFFTRNYSSAKKDKVQLNDYDVQGVVVVDTLLYQNQALKTLTIRFDPSLASVISAEGQSGSNSGISMVIDSLPSFILENKLADTNPNFKVTDLRAIPVVSYNPRDETNYLNIVRAYFQEKAPSKAILTQVGSSITIAPSLNPQGLRLIAITFVVATLLALVYILQKYGIRKAIFCAFVILFTILTETAGLKYVQADLSFATLLGLMLVLIISLSLGIELALTSKDDYMDILTKLRLSAVMLIIICLAIYKFQLNINGFYSLIGVLILFSLILIFESYINFKFLKQIQLFYKIKKTKK